MSRPWVRRVVVAALSALCVVILPDVASASVAGTFSASYTIPQVASMAVACDQSDCAAGSVQPSVTFTAGSSVAGSTWYWWAFDTNPSTRTGCSALASANAWDPSTCATSAQYVYRSSGETFAAGVTTQFAATTPGLPIKFLMVGKCTTATACYTSGIWANGVAASPTTSTPTTTTAPSSGGSTTTPPASTTSPGSTGTTGTGTGCGSTDTPCVVTLADGQSITLSAGSVAVNALTDEQWGDVLMAMACLVFFAAASFVVSLRRGR